MNTEVSFGTRPCIGNTGARNALGKYKRKLTLGIIDAFEKLAKNGVDDEIAINIGIKTGAKKMSTDAIEINYFTKDANNPANSIYTSATALSPKTLEKLPTKRISKLILKAYEKLTKSDKKIEGVWTYPLPTSKIPHTIHQQKINELIDKFGVDDWI